MRDLDVPTHLRDGTRAQHARGGGGKASGGGEEVEKDRGQGGAWHLESSVCTIRHGTSWGTDGGETVMWRK